MKKYQIKTVSANFELSKDGKTPYTNHFWKTCYFKRVDKIGTKISIEKFSATILNNFIV